VNPYRCGYVSDGGHCAYCDHFPLGVEADPTIDHHRPKSTAPALAFEWTNLYGVCALCNRSKRDQWDQDLLRPDAEGYDFFAYFDCDALTGRIEPRPDLTPADQRRAERTLAILGWNTESRPLSRTREARRRPAEQEARPYRFLRA
jgi:uncharacterized protein (TIGR02646 family)